MAEKIGFISFTAFELHKANEFEGIKRRLYNTERPSRNYFEIHPAIPPWRQLALLGSEHIQRRTPSQLQPLMNDYYRYFQDKTIQHEMYLRWWRRHHAWNREEEIFLLRFEDLRNHLAEVYNREAYAQQGRMQALFRKVGERSWENREMNYALADRKHSEVHHIDAHALRKRLQHTELIYKDRVIEPDQHRLRDHVRNEAHDTGTHHTRDLVQSPLAKPPRWAKMLAVADYQQKAQLPMPSAPIETRSETIKPPAMQPPPTLKGGKI